MKIITDNYQDWIDLSRSFVGDELAADVVQEAYLKVSQYNKEINRSYMYLTIRSISYDILKLKSKINKENIEDYHFEDTIEDEKKQAYNKIICKMEDIISSWHWYDAMLFRLYKDTPRSLRTISKETDISLVSIFNTIKKCKKILKEKLQEDYEDYNNEDYELIRIDTN